MPFDGSGNYTRVHDWTDDRDANIKIQASRMDAEMDDQASAFNQVLLRSGVAAMTGDLDMGQQSITSLANGSAASPSIQYNTDPNTGMYLAATGRIGFAANGAEAFHIDTAGVAVTGTLEASGAATLSGNTTVGGTLGVTGAVTCSATLNVTGNATVGGTLGVTGALTGGAGAFSSLTVGGNAVLTTASTIDADTLDGFDSSVFPRLGTANIFSQIQSFGNGVEMDRASGDAYILWKNATVSVAQQRVTSAGKLRFTDAAAALDMFSVDQSGDGYIRNSLGIGIASPSFALEVDAISAQNVANFIGTTGSYVRASNDTGHADFGSISGNNLALRTGAVERMRIDSAGDVGVGTTDANKTGFSKAVTIEGSNNAAIELAGGAAGTDNLIGAVSFYSDNDSFETGRIGVNRRGANTGDMRFELGGSERMRIDADGNLGLGGLDANHPFELTSNSSASGIYVRGRSSDNVGTIALGSNDAASIYGQIQGRSTEFRVIASTTATFYANGAERLRITSAGDVGIGNVSPAAKLDVNGDIHDDKGDVRKLIKSGTTSGALNASHAGYLIRASGGVTLTDDVFAANDTLMILNKSGGDITITEDTNLVLTDTAGNTGNRTLANNGICTVWFNSTNDAHIFGTGLS